MESLEDIYGFGSKKTPYLTGERMQVGQKKVFIVDDAEVVDFQGKKRVRIKICEKLSKGKLGDCYLLTLNKGNAQKFYDAGLLAPDEMINVEIEITCMLVSFKGKEVPGIRITKVSP